MVHPFRSGLFLLLWRILPGDKVFIFLLSRPPALSVFLQSNGSGSDGSGGGGARVCAACVIGKKETHFLLLPAKIISFCSPDTFPFYSSER